jgi:hypothetical protein
MADLFARVGGLGRSTLGAVTNLVVTLSEVVKMTADTITRTWDGTGDVAFNKSPDHATVTMYAARLRVSGNATVIETQPLGVPTPDGNGVIVAPLEGLLAGHTAGDYTISILATNASGSTDSAESNIFTLPLARPIEKVRFNESLTVVRA